MKAPVRIGIIGLGGYAGHHHEAVRALEEKLHARLICTCDPQPQAFAPQQAAWGFTRRGVRVFSDYREMLATCARELDLLVVPTPIHLHAEMHRAAVEAGVAVYLEKPPTLDYRELDAMIALDAARARHATLVGFNFILEPARLALKQRLLAGEFGAVRAAHLLARWARPAGYFSRNSWAGRLVLPDGRLSLDSCFGNAMAHFVHDVLFWAGQDSLHSWAALAGIRAALFRAHRIPGADTFFVEATTRTELTLRFALTHACSGGHEHLETVVCERATLHYKVGEWWEIAWHDGRHERTVLEPFDPLRENHLAYYRYLRGEAPRPATSLAESRPFVVLNDLAYVSAGQIHEFPAARIKEVHVAREMQDYKDVEGLRAAMEAFVATGAWPGAELGVKGDPSPVTVSEADLGRFVATIERLAQAAIPRLLG